MKKAFTLVEMLIVVAILGILAAIVMPTFLSHVQIAKESAAKDSLRILRNAIDLYASQHNEVAPGYLNGDTSATPIWPVFFAQMLKATNSSGIDADLGTPGYPLGPYLSNVPLNPFRETRTINMIANDAELPTQPPDIFGWVYKPATKQIRLDQPGTDSEGITYYDY